MKIRQEKMGKYIFTRDKKDEVFRIPDYQRPYVWDTEKVEEFWKDLLDNHELNLPFVGSFIFKGVKGSKGKRRFLDVVDGQQRIMTIHILLAALRDYARENGENPTLVSSIQGRLSNIDGLGNATGYTLDCWEDVDQFLKDYILSGEKKPSEIKKQKAKRKIEESKYHIIENYKFIYDSLIPTYLEDADLRDTDKAINDVVDEKIHNLEFVYIEVDSDEEAYTAFEIVNARGQELGNIDLVKNLFFKNAAVNDEKDWAAEQWAVFIENTTDIPKVDPEIFLRHFWLSLKGGTDFITRKKLFRAIKSLMGSEENYKTLLEKIVANSKVYSELYSSNEYDWTGESKYNKEIENYLTSIRSFSVIQPNILFLSVVRNKDKFTPRTIRNFFRMIETFHFAYSVIGRGPANKVEKLYAKYAEKVEVSETEKEAEGLYNSLNKELSDILKQNITHDFFIKNFKDISYKKKEVVRFVFSVLEAAYGTDETEINWINANVEHIEPQKDGSNNLDEVVINNIGNLVILSARCNSKVGNISVEDKMEIYRDNDCSRLEVVREVVNFFEENGGQWNKKLVERRAELLAEDMYSKFVFSGKIFN